MPQDAEAKAMAQALRGQLNDANFLSMSTIDPLSNFGQAQRKSTLGTAEKRGNLNRSLAKEARDREIKLADLQDKRRYTEEREVATRDAEFAQSELEAKNQRRRGNREGKTFIDPQGKEVMYDVDNQSGRIYPQGSGFDAEPLNPQGLTEKEKVGRSAYDGRNTGYMKSKEIRSFEEASEDYMGSMYAFDAYKPDFSESQVLGVNTTGLPAVNSIENFAARNIPAVMNDSEKEKAQWWQDYEFFFKLPERHKLFGAALTEGERKSWDAANITKSMTPKQVQKNLTILRSIAQEKMSKMAKNVSLKGGSQEYIDNNLDPLMTEGGGYAPMESEGFRQDTKYEVTGDTVTVTMAELQSLGISREEAEQDGMRVEN